jgi:hypothetical protein
LNSTIAPPQPPQLDRMRHYANDLAVGLGKVASKFVQDAVTGIYLAKSANLTEIAHALDEDIAIHATQKRLSRNLGRANVRDAVSEALLTMAARRVHKDTMLNVHVRDLTKRYARKMQDLFSPEPSPGQHPNGYRICEVVACEPDSDRSTPIAAHLWSCHAPGFTTDSEEIIATIRRVLAATNGRGIIHPSPSIYDHGTRVEDLAAIEGMRGLLYLGTPDPEQGKRRIYRHKSMNDGEIADICDLPYGVTLYKMHPHARGE